MSSENQNELESQDLALGRKCCWEFSCVGRGLRSPSASILVYLMLRFIAMFWGVLSIQGELILDVSHVRRKSQLKNVFQNSILVR